MGTLLTNLPKETLVAQLQDGGILLVLGMGTVFVFLVILIYATKLMSKIVARMQPAEQAAPAQKRPTNTSTTSAKKSDDAAIAAAIAAAYDKQN